MSCDRVTILCVTNNRQTPRNSVFPILFSFSDAFSPLSLLIQLYSGLVDILLQALVVLPPLLNKTSLMTKTSLTLHKSAPRRSPPEVVWGCVWCISSLIQTEGQDVVHKQGRGWRHIICVFWIALSVPVWAGCGCTGTYDTHYGTISLWTFPTTSL